MSRWDITGNNKNEKNNSLFNDLYVLYNGICTKSMSMRNG